MRLFNEEMQFLNKDMYENLRNKYKEEIKGRYFTEVIVVGNILEINLSYNIEDIYNKHLKDNPKSNGLSLMIKRVKIMKLEGNTIKIEINNKENIEYRIKYDATEKTYLNITDKVDETVDMVGLEEYSVSVFVAELSGNTIIHNKDTENIYIRFMSERIKTEDDVIIGLKKGKHIFIVEKGEEGTVHNAIGKTPIKYYSILTKDGLQTFGNIHKRKIELQRERKNNREEFNKMKEFFK